jgi:hypothetical protein
MLESGLFLKNECQKKGWSITAGVDAKAVRDQDADVLTP